MATPQHIQALFEKYLTNRIDENELQELLDHFQSGEDKQLLLTLIEREMGQTGELGSQSDTINLIADSVERKLLLKSGRVHRMKVFRIASAIAATIILAATFTFYFNIKNKVSPEQRSSLTQQDLPAGGQKATLTLSNGEVVDLGNVNNGKIAIQGASTIMKTEKGMITYNPAGVLGTGTLYNIISTPKGGEYRLQLPDGTKVWLNAASSLKYPTSFASLKERKVELTGEGYFEVSQDKKHPFLVQSSLQTIEVLGTHFNVKAYEDERNTSTTLLEGSVKVTAKNTVKVIKPGQQTLTVDGLTVREVDVDVETAWKNGRTYFKDADIKTIMRTLSRWYNIDVEYRGEPGNELFTGGISRKSNLSGLLKILAAGDIHATVENGKLIVRP